MDDCEGLPLPKLLSWGIDLCPKLIPVGDSGGGGRGSVSIFSLILDGDFSVTLNSFLKPVVKLERCPHCGSTVITPIFCADDMCPHRDRCESYQNAFSLTCAACGWVENCLRFKKTLLKASLKASLRAAPRGSGRQLSKLKTRLSESEARVIKLLEARKAFSRETGLTRNQVWQAFKEEYPQLRYPTSHSITAWLSSLLGCGFLEMAYGAVELVDKAIMKMWPKRIPVWWLREDYQKREIGFDEERIIRRFAST